MRKICISIILVILISSVCLFGMAENVHQVTLEGFRVKAVIPKGYTYSERFVSDILYVGLLQPEDPSKPEASVTIAFDDTAEGKTLNDMSEEEIDRMIALFLQDTPSATVTKSETGKGTKLLIFDTNTSNECLYDIITIWHGYQVAMRVIPARGSTLSDEQKQMVNQFLTDIDIESL
ncbi:MAG: hypothetical protein IJ088_13745 [Clostridia bacterium]|nr:hypothetical protein [Clostridia bacterium]